MSKAINANLEVARTFKDAYKAEHPRRAKAIDAIWDAGMTLIEQGKSLNKESVGRLSHSAGGPNGHSIRKQKDYGHLVELIAQVDPKRSSRKSRNDLQVLNAIGNEVDRSRIRQVIQERDHLLAKLAWLKKAVPQAVWAGQDQTTSSSQTALPSLNEVGALPDDALQEIGKLLTATFWHEVEAELRDGGIYIDGVKILDKVALDALEKVTARIGVS